MKIQSKYLKHKSLSNCSPDTVKRIAYALTYYLSYLDELEIEEKTVLGMKYSEQFEHFTSFLLWIKSGKHTDRSTNPDNNTCNAYLGLVFGFYYFLVVEYEDLPSLKILEQGSVSGSTMVGVKFTKNISLFKGYLPSEEHYGNTTDKSSIQTLLDACTCTRNQLLLLLLAETGFRIGEILGIRYAEDIDYETKSLRVIFRPDNLNRSRAKNAEYRSIKVSDQTFDLLLYYLSENRTLLKDTEYLFINLHKPHIGRPMTRNGVYSFLYTLEKITSIKATPHMLRHYFANERRKAGWDLLMISRALGHKHIRTTELYLHIDEKELKDASEQFFETNKDIYDISELI